MKQILLPIFFECNKFSCEDLAVGGGDDGRVHVLESALLLGVWSFGLRISGFGFSLGVRARSLGSGLKVWGLGPGILV